jgi:hypothetical protein
MKDLWNRRRGWITAAVAALVLGAAGVSAGLATSSSPTAAVVAPATAASAAPGGLGANARSAPSSGGAVGTVSSLSTSGFAMTTATGQKVTVTSGSATTYKDGTSAASSSAVTPGQPVLVLGTTSGTTITARQVIVHPPVAASSNASQVVPFQRGAAAVSKQVGQIPASYSQGAGTIVSGTAADSATTAALGAYPGGIVNRVVQLSSGEYEVHTIGVSWPHHVFVDQSFQVIGAN